MYFKDKEHEEFYNKKIGQVKQKDAYKNNIIYLLSSDKETRNNFEEIYSIKNNTINIYSLKASWQTGTSINICRLAFNLFGEMASDNLEEGASYLYTVSSIFSNIDINIGIEALKIMYTY